MTTLPLPIEKIRGRLDARQIEAAAISAASQLTENAVACILLCPGDMTAYRIVVIDDQSFAWGGGRYVVGTSFGSLYPWGGQRMHADYVTTKWVADGNLWTGVVITEFLNALHDLLVKDAP